MSWISRFFNKSSGVEIYKVLAITPGRMRAWVNSSVGVIKKPNTAIPTRLLDAFGEYNRDRYMQFISNR